MALPDVIRSIGDREYAQVKIQGPWYQSAAKDFARTEIIRISEAVNR